MPEFDKGDRVEVSYSGEIANVFRDAGGKITSILVIDDDGDTRTHRCYPVKYLVKKGE